MVLLVDAPTFTFPPASGAVTMQQTWLAPQFDLSPHSKAVLPAAGHVEPAAAAPASHAAGAEPGSPPLVFVTAQYEAGNAVPSLPGLQQTSSFVQ